MTMVHVPENCCSVYPGSFVPLPEAEDLMEELKANCKNKATSPVNVDEFEDHFIVEMMVPSVKREEIVVYICNNILSVSILHKPVYSGEKKLRLHEFDTICERNILLPETADAEFIIAEYRKGLLTIYIPKTTEVMPPVSHRIIVY